MQINRSVSLADLMVSGGLFLLAIICAVFAVFTPQVWNTGMIVAIIGALGGFGLVAGIFITKLVWGGPTYITKQNTAVWIGDTLITKALCEKAIEFFVTNIVILCESIKESSVRDMLKKTNIIFSNKPLSSIGKGYYLTNNAGLQFGYTVGVCSQNNKITGTAFFHEFMHEVMLTIQNKEIDYNHTDPIMWKICSQIEIKWVNEINE